MSAAPKYFPARALVAALLAALAATACAPLEQERRPGRSARTERAEPAVAAAPAGVPEVWPASAPQIYASSAILVDADTGRTIFQKNADVRRQVASTQKLLTAMLVAERGNLDAPLTIAAEDTRVEPTKLGVRAGESYTRRSLLTAMMVKSSNDAAAALARDHSGSVGEFVATMNRRAYDLGAYSSHFANPHGLPGPQYSTARDIARVAHRAYRYADLRAMMVMPSYTFRHASGRTTRLEATNKLLARSPVFNGMKTGYTHAAGRCLVTSVSYNGRNLILVQLGSRTQYIFDDAERIMRWALGDPGPQPMTGGLALSRW